MKILLTTLNSKFIHSNLAIKYLDAMIRDKVDSVVEEFTINEDIEDILSKIMIGGYDMVAFSCYIWNIERTMKIAENIKKISPETLILIGGPEVTYDAESTLQRHDFIDFIIAGEGEKALSDLVDIIKEPERFKEITNLYSRYSSEDMDFESRSLVVTDLSIIPPVYLDTKKEDIENKIVYYETSRGCTFSCSYCLSSTTKGVRFFDYERIKAELSHLVKLGARQVKFVDRTFNSDEKKAIEIISFLMEIDDGNINFHFEITAHLLQKPVLDLIKKARRGLFQFEIGVQSTNDETLNEVRRANKFEEVSKNVLEIKSYANIHQHLDLIAGLPYEGLTRFKKSFNDVFSLKPDALQLGFLKILKGSPIENTIEKHGYKYRSYPPYEVLSNKYMTYKDMDKLKTVENVLDRFYNTGRFKYSIEYLYDRVYENTGYNLFEDLAAVISDNNINTIKKEEEFRAMKILGMNRVSKENSNPDFNIDFFVELLRLDYINMGRNPNIPAFLTKKNEDETERELKEFIFEFTRNQENLIQLGFKEDVHYKDAYKKINWSIFEYDMVQYISEIRKPGVVNIKKEKNVLIVNYDSKKGHNGDYKMLRRLYEI
ncbi:B12-binding domain-containing radical SAM protein [Proteocatella sphenisci]|uniref:B12-binding domain-containing radical SAM protein n=1 Tax=Proteocatella sphenisci TaxID=181070 RepID=UPI0004BB4D97|nr:B12-binding domain-containing radical SAM protein [Proteocatella sphenisci]